jgi:hypothetical protein
VELVQADESDEGMPDKNDFIEKLTREETIRLARQGEPVVWLTNRGAIAMSTDGGMDLTQGVDRNHFKDDRIFVDGVAGLSGAGHGWEGDTKSDKKFHDALWEDFRLAKGGELNCPIEKLTDELFEFHNLKTAPEREALREMVAKTFMRELCAGIAAKNR